jgi:small conductance mechanosensitive channel
MPEFWDKIYTSLPSWTAHLAAVSAIVLAAWLFDRLFISALRRVVLRVGVSSGAVSFLFNSFRIMLLCAIVLAVLQQFGVETTSMLALLGASGAAVALSLQGFLNNFAAGLVLLGERLLRLGDTIEVGDVRGEVVEMQALHVVVETAERIRVCVPNAMLINGPFRNYSALPTRRVQWLLPLPGSIDPAPVKDELRTCLLADTRILRDPAPAVYVREWSLDRQTLAIQAWTSAADAQAVQDQLLEALGKIMEKHARPPAKKTEPAPGT